MYVETLDEFTAKHGEYIDQQDGWRVFADGAAVRADDGFGRLNAKREPPTDQLELLQVKRIFIQGKHDAEVRAFERYRNELTQQLNLAIQYPGSCPPPPEAATASLEEGRRRVYALRKQLAEIDVKLAKSPDALARIARQSRENARLDGLYNLQAAIKAVSL